jgi:TolB-like protein/DNA-binding winged helix-turn-helix (wHTH) protein
MVPQTKVPVLTEPCNFADKGCNLADTLRNWPSQPGVKMFQFEGYTLDVARASLRTAHRDVPLRPKAFEVLRYLVENADRLVTKDELIQAIWPNVIVTDEALTHCVSEARQAIGDGGQAIIKTLPRRGYRFAAAVTRTVAKAEGPFSAAPEARGGTSGPDGSPGLTPELSLPDKPSVAVLPFANMSGNPEEDYFADGMAEEIITALSRCAWLFVIARNSSFTYKGKVVDVRHVGRELGVRYVLEGSVRRAGNRLRFTGQLIDCASGTHIWADRFEGATSDVFDLQDLFTASVVAAIEPKMQLAEIERLKHKPLMNLDTYDLVLRAHQFVDEFTGASLTAALRHLEQALAIDPTHAAAMALAAYCRAQLIAQGWTQDLEKEAKEGLRLASRAIELGKDDGNVFWMTAFAVLNLQLDAPRARELAYRSLELNPNSSIALGMAGRAELHSGNTSKALELLYRAERLSPRDPRGWFITTGIAVAYYHEGRFDEAISACRRALNLNPRQGGVLRTLAACLVKQGRQSEAAEVAQKVLEAEPLLTLTRLRARAMYLMNSKLWNEFSAALRIAGIPE